MQLLTFRLIVGETLIDKLVRIGTLISYGLFGLIVIWVVVY